MKSRGQSAKLLIHKNGSGAATRNSSETSIKHKMLRIKPRLAFINGVLLENRVLISCFQLLVVYVLLVHSCGECRIILCHRIGTWEGCLHAKFYPPSDVQLREFRSLF
jgi:hypothetical protein